MIEPDFGEYQFQSAISMAIAHRYQKRYGSWIGMRIPTLPLEAKLGWDAGYYFGFLKAGKNKKHLGCNFFIQYKIANQYGKRGRYFPKWKKDYFQYQVPHRKNREKIFKQWSLLKRLSNKGYPTCYCSNRTVDFMQLIKAYGTSNVLDHAFFLSLKKMAKMHTYVTYPTTGKDFKLHSRIIEGSGGNFEDFESEFLQVEKRDLQEDIDIALFEIKSSHEELRENIYSESLGEIGRMNSSDPVRAYFNLREFLLNNHGIAIFRHEEDSV